MYLSLLCIGVLVSMVTNLKVGSKDEDTLSIATDSGFGTSSVITAATEVSDSDIGVNQNNSFLDYRGCLYMYLMIMCVRKPRRAIFRTRKVRKLHYRNLRKLITANYGPAICGARPPYFSRVP